MAEAPVNIQIKAQPQALYRERYISELDPKRNRAQRFIRADPNAENFEYPTIEVMQTLILFYLLFSSVTLPSDSTTSQFQFTTVCSCHSEHNLNRTSSRSLCTSISSRYTWSQCAERLRAQYTLFSDHRRWFSIRCEKVIPFQKKESRSKLFLFNFSFRITRKKLIQYELKRYGPLRVLNSDERDIPRLSDPTDARKLIDLYQLGKSQLVFSLAELISPERFPIIYDMTSTSSIIMTAISGSTAGTNEEEAAIRYVPNRCSWHGGQEVLMVIPKIDRRKGTFTFCTDSLMCFFFSFLSLSSDLWSSIDARDGRYSHRIRRYENHFISHTRMSDSKGWQWKTASLAGDYPRLRRNCTCQFHLLRM